MLGTGGMLTAMILPAIGINCGPVGWIVTGVSLTVEAGILLLESRGDKLARARARLEKELTESVNVTCDNIWTQLEKNVGRLVSGKIDLVLSELTKIGKVIDSLATTQVDLADSLRMELRSLNMIFTGNIASAVFGKEEANGYLSNITLVSRIPGVYTLLAEEREGSVGEEFRLKISDLIAEDVGFVTATDDAPSFISNVLGGLVSPENIICDEENNIVTIKTSDKNIRLFNRLRLLEQFVPYKIGG